MVQRLCCLLILEGSSWAGGVDFRPVPGVNFSPYPCHQMPFYQLQILLMVTKETQTRSRGHVVVTPCYSIHLAWKPESNA